jgi:hypothetical protein
MRAASLQHIRSYPAVEGLPGRKNDVLVSFNEAEARLLNGLLVFFPGDVQALDREMQS